MKLEEILMLSKNKMSAGDIYVYCALKLLVVNNKMPSINNELIPVVQMSRSNISRSIKKLEQNNIITCIKENGFNKRKIYFNKTNEKTVKKKGIKKPKCGIYKIYIDSDVYVGQSRNIEQRWKVHKMQINRDIHPYFTSTQAEDILYEILEECHLFELRIKEILWSQRIKDKGLKVLNEENFILI